MVVRTVHAQKAHLVWRMLYLIPLVLGRRVIYPKCLQGKEMACLQGLPGPWKGMNVSFFACLRNDMLWLGASGYKWTLAKIKPWDEVFIFLLSCNILDKFFLENLCRFRRTFANTARGGLHCPKCSCLWARLASHVWKFVNSPVSCWYVCLDLWKHCQRNHVFFVIQSR